MEGIFRIEQFNPILRTEAHRAGCSFVQTLSSARVRRHARRPSSRWRRRRVPSTCGSRCSRCATCFKWSDADKEAGVRARLHAVILIGRMSAPAEELAAVLGEGVLDEMPAALKVKRHVIVKLG